MYDLGTQFFIIDFSWLLRPFRHKFCFLDNKKALHCESHSDFGAVLLYPLPPLPPLPRKVTSDTLVSTRDKTLVPSSCCYSRPQLADETRVRIIPTFSGQFKPRMVQHVIRDMPGPARRSTLIQR